MDRLSAGFFTLLDELTIARSRRHIQRYYRNTLTQIGQFPKRKRPEAIFSEIDIKGRFLSYDRLNDEISNYKLSLFNPSHYVKPEFKSIYEREKIQTFNQQRREELLIGMMKVNFLKRLESSVHSFGITMERTVNKIEDLEGRLRRFVEHQTQLAEDVQPDFFIEPDEEDEELAQAFQVGAKLKFEMAHLNVEDWRRELAEDKRQLSMLLGAARLVDPKNDAKLGELRRIIERKVKHPTINALVDKV